MATPVASVPVRWPLSFPSETATSDHASAACYRDVENVGIMPVIVAELEFRDVERHVFLADLVEAADDPALENRPEAFDGLSVDGSDNVFPRRMIDGFVG